MKSFEVVLTEEPLNPQKNEAFQLKLLTSDSKIQAIVGLTKEEAEKLRDFLVQNLK